MSNTKQYGAIVAIIVVIAAVGIGLYAFLPGGAPPVESESLKIAQIETGDLSFAYARVNHESLLRVVSALNTTETPIEVSATFNVGPAEFTSVAEAYILDGYQVLACNDVTYEGSVADLAENYPNVYFIGSGGWSASSATGNVSVMAWDIWKGYYLAGIIAGSMTLTGTIGWVSAFEFPDNARIFNMFMAGAQSYNASVTGSYLFTGDWHDAVLSATAASTLIDAGADVLAATGQGLVHGVLAECLTRGVYAIGYDWDEYELAPSVILTSVLYIRDAYLTNLLGAILAGTFGGVYLTLGIEDGATNIAPYHDLEDDIPLAARNQVADVIADIIAGTFTLPAVATTMP